MGVWAQTLATFSEPPESLCSTVRTVAFIPALRSPAEPCLPSALTLVSESRVNFRSLPSAPLKETWLPLTALIAPPLYLCLSLLSALAFLGAY